MTIRGHNVPVKRDRGSGEAAAGTDGAATLVNCKGNIAATYGNEVQKISLERQTYKVQQVGGEWRVCGYK